MGEQDEIEFKPATKRGKSKAAVNPLIEEIKQKIEESQEGVERPDTERLVTNMQSLLQQSGVLNRPSLTVDSDPLEVATEELNVSARVPVPIKKDRVVIIRKISRYAFRLGLEKQPGSPMLVPGAMHIWSPDFIGDNCVTGLEQDFEKRRRLEKKLGVNLEPTSPFWADLNYKLEDREHGLMLNLDDPQFGAFNEVVLSAMEVSSIIANGLHEYYDQSKPNAEWYVENTEREMEIELAKQEPILKASMVFNSASETTLRYAAIMLDLTNSRASHRGVRVSVFKFISASHENASKFLKILEMDKTRLEVEVAVRMAITFGIFTRTPAREYKYHNEVIGSNIDQIVTKLSKHSNSGIVHDIMKDLADKAAL